MAEYKNLQHIYKCKAQMLDLVFMTYQFPKELTEKWTQLCNSEKQALNQLEHGMGADGPPPAIKGMPK